MIVHTRGQTQWLKHGSILYNDGRDVAWNFGDIVRRLNERIDSHVAWPAMNRMLLDPNCVTDEQLGEAARAFATFVSSAAERPDEDMLQLLDRSGWWSVPDAAQIAYMALLGQIMTGVYWHGAREATAVDAEGATGPCSNVRDIIASGMLASQLMRMTPWKRRWYVAKAHLRRFLPWAK